jgi:hypothetical protein
MPWSALAGRCSVRSCGGAAARIWWGSRKFDAGGRPPLVLLVWYKI